jgi:ribosomal protein S13
LFNNFVYNSILFYEDIQLKLFTKNNFGLKNEFLKSLKKRLETNELDNLNKYNEYEKELFYIFIYKIIPENGEVFRRKFFNILMLDVLTTYRGWRHFRGLPTRGQRTWTNAWSPYKSNNILRQFRIKNNKYVYGNAPVKESNIAYSAEYVNYLWKLQWLNEWLSAKANRLRFKGHPNSMKIDLYSMANYQVMHPLKLKNLSKKQKQSFKKNYFSLGFEIGFTKYLLQNIFHTGSDKPDYSLSKSSVVLRDERLNRKKKQRTKIESVKKVDNIKKKKKSVWD